MSKIIAHGGHAPGIALEVHNCEAGRSIVVRWSPAPDVEDRVIDYIEARKSTHAIFEIESDPVPNEYGKVLDVLYPTCHHGMSASLCMDPVGPHHYGTYEQERQDALAGGW